MHFEMKYLFIGAFQVIGYCIEGCSGFGGTVFASAINAMVLGAVVAVPFQTLITIPVLYYSAIRDRKYIVWKDLGIILCCVIPFILVGNYVGLVLDPIKAKIAIGSIVTFIALMNIYKAIICPLVLKKPAADPDKPDSTGMKVVRFLFLIAGGIVHGAFNIGGPLLTVYTLNAVKDKVHFRNTMIAMWACLNTINVVRQFMAGRYTTEVLSVAVIALPFTFIGYALGKKLMYKVNREQFLRIVYCVLLVVGANMLITTLISLGK